QRAPQRDHPFKFLVVIVRDIWPGGSLKRDRHIEHGVIGVRALSIAAVYTYGLNDDPTWRNAWVARLNFDKLKSRPPPIAYISPLALSMAMSAPCAPESCSRVTRDLPRAPSETILT